MRQLPVQKRYAAGCKGQVFAAELKADFDQQTDLQFHAVQSVQVSQIQFAFYKGVIDGFQRWIGPVRLIHGIGCAVIQLVFRCALDAREELNEADVVREQIQLQADHAAGLDFGVGFKREVLSFFDGFGFEFAARIGIGGFGGVAGVDRDLSGKFDLEADFHVCRHKAPERKERDAAQLLIHFHAFSLHAGDALALFQQLLDSLVCRFVEFITAQFSECVRITQCSADRELFRGNDLEGFECEIGIIGRGGIRAGISHIK